MLTLNLQFHSAPGSLSALREATFDHLQLNCGIFLKNFSYDSLADAEALLSAIESAIQNNTGLLGVTRGGGNFNVSRELRNPDIDGLRYRFKGGTFVDSADPYLSTNLVETTPENFALGLGGFVTTSGKKKTVKMPTALNDSSYLQNICWCGELADGQLVLIVLYNAINTADFSFTFQDKSEGVIAVEFHGCQDDVLDYDEAPFEVIFFETSGELGSLTVSSAAGTNVGGTKITTNHTLGTGEKFVYKVGTAQVAPAIGYHEDADYTWTEWDGSSDIAVGASANGKKITVAVLNSDNKAIMSGNCTLTVKTT